MPSGGALDEQHAFISESLEAVRRGARLVGAAAEHRRSARREQLGRAFDLRLALDRAGAADGDETAIPKTHAGDLDDAALPVECCEWVHCLLSMAPSAPTRSPTKKPPGDTDGLYERSLAGATTTYLTGEYAPESCHHHANVRCVIMYRAWYRAAAGLSTAERACDAISSAGAAQGRSNRSRQAISPIFHESRWSVFAVRVIGRESSDILGSQFGA